jgi:hypothetical protein
MHHALMVTQCNHIPTEASKMWVQGERKACRRMDHGLGKGPKNRRKLQTETRQEMTYKKLCMGVELMLLCWDSDKKTGF